MTRAFPWRALALCLIVAGAAIIVACNDDSDDAGDPSTRLNVVATLPLFADIVSNVSGDRASVDSLLPRGADPHTFEPSPGDVRKIVEADAIFANGLDLEPTLLRAIGANLSSDAVLVELAEAAISAGVSTLPTMGSGGPDPHLWMDPEIGRDYAAIIRDTLSSADPDGGEIYSGNYETYAALLDDTAQYMRDTAAIVPVDDRLLIATHDAFGYLARTVDFEVAGFVVPGPGQDASPEDISKLITKIEELDIPAVFTEPQTSVETRTLEQIAADAGAEVCELYSDALDKVVTTYVELLRFDAEELVRCLGGVGG
ncbi:MAG TPA: metal ABC transporter substrate-binding protein [Dehalococcoidia bacterium]